MRTQVLYLVILNYMADREGLGMFSPRTNDGYFELGLETAKIIRESVAY